ncbi:MAG: capsular polysaccharide synthesis protein [Thermodesulfobacteriota bacterium]
MIPKKIWILWFQGISKAPFIVRECVESWRRENPNWEIEILNKENLNKYIILDFSEKILTQLDYTKQSNLIRLQLLSEYGGVWVDATTYCIKPLDDWIHEYTNSGFFAFHRPGRNKIMANWFMASYPGCPIVVKMKDRYVRFFEKNNFKKIGTLKLKIRRLLALVLNRNTSTARYWFSPVVTKFLRIYPYFIFHYLFEKLVSEDPQCRIIWNSTKKIPASGPHKLLASGLYSPLSQKIKNEIDERKNPLYKLTWKKDHSQYSPSSTIYYLLEGRYKNFE